MYTEDSINGWYVNTEPLQYDRNIKKQYNDFRVKYCTYKIKRKLCGNCG